MRQIAVIVYGPPGSGKGTQARFTADKFGLIHFDTGRFFEAVVHDPKRQREKLVKRERRLFDTGKLLTPSWVLKVVSEEVKRIAKASLGVVFSGSPRTIFEAKGLLPVLDKLYGRKNIFVFVLRVPDAVSVKRNSSRLICSVCGSPLLAAYYPKVKPKHCPVCGGPFYKRTLDNPATIKVRLNEYRERTEPIVGLLKERGYRVTFVDGTTAPFKVFQKINAKIGG